MRKLLWIGDAAVASGFARCTHETLEVLRKSWDVHVLGINYQGDPHEYPYPIYPCWPGGDAFGVQRTADVIGHIKPELVLIQNDPWNIKQYMDQIKEFVPSITMVASMPVDGKNCVGKDLNGLHLAIFWTQFGLDEARAGGYEGPATVIPLGVDLDKYRPVDRKAAHEKIGLPMRVFDQFIVGNINRNQPRKRLDLTVQYFAEWVKEYKIDDAYLFLHVIPTGELGYNVQQLMQYYGFRGDKKRLILQAPEMGHGLGEEWMHTVYGCFDLQFSTTQGEGWGLTTMEGMACGVPQIVPDWAALGEWCEDAALKIPCPGISVTPNHFNTVGGVPDKEKMIEALHSMYLHENLRKKHRDLGYKLVSKPEYRWENIGEKFAGALDAIPNIDERRKSA